MPLLRGPVAAFAAVMLCTVALPADGAQRTFVSTGGSDSSACSLVAPCRSFTAALSRTDADGEIIVLDSGGYGPVSIAQSVAITAPPGVYAGISVLSNDGVTIATPGVRVALRGLTINGLGGFAGINLSQGARLEVERCTIGGLAYGLFATAANATIVLTDSVVSDSGNKGVYLVASAMTATLERVRIERTSGIGGDGLYLGGGIRASVRESTIVGNGASGILATDSVAAGPSLVVSHSVVTDNVQYGVILVALQSTTARASISDSVLARNGQGGIVTYATAAGGVAIKDITRTTVVWNTGDGVYFSSQPGAGARGALTASTIADNSGDGVYVSGAGTIAVASANTLLRNFGHGFTQAGSGVFRSRGDNTIESSANGNISGTISPASGPY